MLLDKQTFSKFDGTRWSVSFNPTKQSSAQDTDLFTEYLNCVRSYSLYELVIIWHWAYGNNKKQLLLSNLLLKSRTFVLTKVQLSSLLEPLSVRTFVLSPWIQANKLQFGQMLKHRNSKNYLQLAFIEFTFLGGYLKGFCFHNKY